MQCVECNVVGQVKKKVPWVPRNPVLFEIFRKVIASFSQIWTFAYESHIHMSRKIDGVGPVDNRPFTDKLYHFVLKKK